MSRARDLADTISGNGQFSASAIPNLDASKITSGSLADARIPNLATSKITSGTFADARLSSSSVTQHVDLSNLNADNLTSGTIASARLSLGASDIPNLSANKITSDSLSADRIPNLSAAKITSGTMDGSRISGGTFGAVNGSALTSLPSSAPSSFSVVGAYAFAYGDTNKHQGHTSGGGNLSFASGGGSGQSFSQNGVGGTWRLHGFNGTGGNNTGTSLWVRIS